MFPLTITLKNRAELDAVLAALYPAADTPLPVITAAPGPAPVKNAGKPPAAAKPATTAAEPAATKPTATEPAAAAASDTKASSVSDTTPPAAAPFAYSTLQQLVMKLIPTHGDALREIARKHGEPHGATTFKSLPPEVWAAAYADVQALEAV